LSPWEENTTRKLFAVSESDKGIQWQFDFGLVKELNPPAVSGGKVFAATSNSQSSFMWSFDAATGGQLSKTAFGSTWDRYQAPTIEGGVAYTGCGYNTVCAFNTATGAREMTSTS
jgi:hypothetical protein